MIEQRLDKLEIELKKKFSNMFDSVKNAFLHLDSNYDGYITVEDIMRHFGTNDKDLNYNDLKKLITDKDSKKEGRINYMDFSKWLGGSIHQCEGFYFRHDSKKNPPFDKRLQEIAEKGEQNVAATDQFDLTQLRQMILEKIKF